MLLQQLKKEKNLYGLMKAVFISPFVLSFFFEHPYSAPIPSLRGGCGLHSTRLGRITAWAVHHTWFI